MAIIQCQPTEYVMNREVQGEEWARLPHHFSSLTPYNSPGRLPVQPQGEVGQQPLCMWQGMAG